MSTPSISPQQKFIADLYPAALQVSKETGMSWELILAQAAQETGWGAKVLPGTHNIFNIKASGDWHGPTKTFNVWEIESGHKVWKDQAFRAYSSNEQALRDRVAFLRGNPRYSEAGLFEPGVAGDLHREAQALQRGRYATDPAYASHLEAVFNGPTMQAAVAYAKTHTSNVSETREVTPGVQSDADPGHTRAAIFHEARLHFLGEDTRFEYGRSDTSLRNREGNLRTDPSRNEQDRDGDGLKGVDCSSFVWRGLKNAGYDVPASPFTSHDLFNGPAITAYARRNFDFIPAATARSPHGSLQTGDVLLFRDRSGSGQHVAIFKSYDANGNIQFIGSQVSRGPEEVTVAPGGYWDGRTQEIVGALRAKPSFHVRGALHAGGLDATATNPASLHPRTGEMVRDVGSPSHHVLRRHAEDGHSTRLLQHGDKSPAVATLQRRLFELDYRGEDGKPLGIDGDFGRNTLFALKQFQREHGLQGKGVAGPKTEVALARAEHALLSNPGHPQHGLYRQALEKVHDAEATRGTRVGAHSERIAAALTVACVRRGIGCVDRVEINRENTLAYAVHDRPGNAESGLGNTDMVSLAQASRQSIGESSRQADDAARNAPAQVHAPQPQRHHAAPVLAH